MGDSFNSEGYLSFIKENFEGWDSDWETLDEVPKDIKKQAKEFLDNIYRLLSVEI